MVMRLAAATVGIVFGVTLCWSGMSDPDVIRGALLLEQSYLFLFFASAVFVAAAGTGLLRLYRGRALLSGTPLVFSRQRPARRHVVGSLLFGVGWGVADACPGPIVTQLGQGILWAVFTFAGTAIGVGIFLRRSGAGETEPAVDRRNLVTPVEAPVPAPVS